MVIVWVTEVANLAPEELTFRLLPLKMNHLKHPLNKIKRQRIKHADHRETMISEMSGCIWT